MNGLIKAFGKKTYHIQCQIMLINDHRHHWQLLITRWKKQFLTQYSKFFRKVLKKPQ